MSTLPAPGRHLPEFHQRPHDHVPASARGYLDGLRGASALYVVLHHAWQQVGPIPIRPPLALMFRSLKYGHYSVAIFIVLSGYCLMLPVAASPEGRLRGGFSGYIWRRAKRIIPPYYAVLVICLAAIALIPALQTPSGTRWDASLPALNPGTIWAHFALVHNLNMKWLPTIDGPLWSVATEWQIYFAFPLLLWIWRRWGIGWAVAAGFAVGYGLLALGRVFGSVVALEACPWYLGLFAIGMAAVVSRPSRPWGWYVLGLLLAGGAFSVVDAKFQWMAALGMPQRVFLDAIVGGIAACLILHCEGRDEGGDSEKRDWPGSIVRRVLESRPALWLGSFSYSLYLIHDPLLAWSGLAMQRAGWSASAILAAMTVVVPGIVLTAYLFYLAFERPFMSRGAAARRQLLTGSLGASAQPS
jgi:peptidoglycan/LPS O-acetylase OafA/YrhL